MKGYVVFWRWYDGSAAGVLPTVWVDKDEAQDTLKLLQEHGMREYTIVPVTIKGERNE